MRHIIDLAKVNLTHVGIVGGKNASTGEMIQSLTSRGIRVPGGFATTVDAYLAFLTKNALSEKITEALQTININDINHLDKTSAQIRQWILGASYFSEFENEIADAYNHLTNKVVAVRSSATFEDSAANSFAGAHESFLNVNGLPNLLNAIKQVYASLFSSRAIAYRVGHQFPHDKVALSVGVQPMVRSDKGASGVMFTMDTESGFDKVILITASYGLGEAIVQGQVNPDEFIVLKEAIAQNKSAILQRRLGEKALKIIYSEANTLQELTKTIPVPENERRVFCINDEDVKTLAKQALLIEEHYQKKMDIEWGKDGETGEIYILQARPETVKSNMKHEATLERYVLIEKGPVISEGQSVGQRIASGTAKIILDPKEMHQLKPGEILVTDMTDPDWEPIMKKAGAIVTNRGGRTCHAAIISRELGIPALVGCSDATQKIEEGELITVSCADGQIGKVYRGKLAYRIDHITANALNELPVKICINIGNPEKAFATQFLPNDGVGLARLEFIINNHIGIHPNAILALEQLPQALKNEILEKTQAYKNPTEFYVEKLREGISTIAAAFYPKPVIFRFSDFKSNEYANLLGGKLFEPTEENPMLGFRGASRYIDAKFRPCFELECLAFRRVREEMGLHNAQLMIPFARTVSELSKVIALLHDNHLQRGKEGLVILMMCEIPANVILAEEFLAQVDGFSIGSNDLTQLTLGLDRDSSIVAHLFDEQNEAVKTLLKKVIKVCREQGKYVGICGQAPSDYPEFAEWLMQQGIESISLTADSIMETRARLAKKLTLKKNKLIASEKLVDALVLH